jgi:hypothetical protein
LDHGACGEQFIDGACHREASLDRQILGVDRRMRGVHRHSGVAMLAYGTQTFLVRDFVRTGIAITVLAYVLTLIFGATYWHWLGYV